MNELETRAREIAEFLGISNADAEDTLLRGFAALHNDVTADFRLIDPRNDEQLLEWYRTTEAYIWELTAYHLDEGFNYSGMCEGIAKRLKEEGADKVLCLGDGVGDLTLSLLAAGIKSPTYHDLGQSATARFALSRFRGKQISFQLSDGWDASGLWWGNEVGYDAIVSLDFMEHVTLVEDWCYAIYKALKPGGLFCAQNAYDCGSGPNGSIPMHLSRNDKYAHATPETNGLALWDHLLFGIGFEQISSNWYRKPA